MVSEKSRKLFTIISLSIIPLLIIIPAYAPTTIITDTSVSTNNVFVAQDTNSTRIFESGNRVLTTVSSINDLGDVNISSPSNGQVLKFDAASNTWKNLADETGGGATGTVRLNFENATEHEITDTFPNYRVLAKWRLDGFDASESNTKRSVMLVFAHLTAAMRDTTAPAGFIEFSWSNDDINYNAETGVSSSIPSYTGQAGIESGGAFLQSDTPGFSTGFIRLAETKSSGAIAFAKNVKLEAEIVVPAGVTVTRIA